MRQERIGQYSHHIMHLLALNMDRHACPTGPVDYRPHPERLTIVGKVRDEVVAPDMAAIARSGPDARAIVRPLACLPEKRSIF